MSLKKSFYQRSVQFRNPLAIEGLTGWVSLHAERERQEQLVSPSVADDGCGIFLSLSRVNIALPPHPIITAAAALEIFWATEIRGDDAITDRENH